MGGLDVNKRGGCAEESVMMESGSGTGRTWSVLLLCVLHYPYTSPMGSTHFIPALIDMKKLEQQHLDSSEPSNAHARMLSYLSQS